MFCTIKCEQESIISKCMKKHEDMMLEAFSEYGYSKEWLLENSSRVSGSHLPSNEHYDSATRYYVDDKPLFEISRIFVFDNNDYT